MSKLWLKFELILRSYNAFYSQKQEETDTSIFKKNPALSLFG